METNKCSVSKTLQNVHHCICRSTRHSQILDLYNVSGSYSESVTLHPLGTADHNCMHSILVSCTLLKMFWHGLMILQWLSGAVWTVRSETSLFFFFLKHCSDIDDLRDVVSSWVSLYTDTSIPNNTVKDFPDDPLSLNLLLNEKKKDPQGW